MVNSAVADELGIRKTKFESSLDRKGSILVKVMHELGSLAGAYHSTLEVSALRLFVPGNERDCTEAIRIEMREGDQEGRINFLDMDEVDNLLAGLEYMAGCIAHSQNYRGDYTEMVFSTRGDFSVGFYLSEGKVQAFLKSGRKTFLTSAVLPELALLLRAGQAHLSSTPITRIA
jgi:hypothetical protein